MTFTMIQRRPGALPAELTGFVGRAAELADLDGLLRASRLVTVVGPGGVGKTRLALRAAGDAAPRYADGVCLVELSGLRGAELLPHTVAGCLGLPAEDSRPALDAVLDHLRDREILIVLDTCEHLVDACAMLTDVLLREAPAVTVLATSRQPLDVPGEHSLPVAPLPVPDSADAPAGEGDAVALFAQRAAAVVTGFAVTPENRSDIVRLCRRLDGMPLAIELATVRLRAIPLKQLIERLDDRFRLLTGGRRTALPRHQTLRTAIAWSHDLCTGPERLLWQRLSVFADSFDVGAVEDVCSGGELPREEVLETLINLVDKSLVLRLDDEEGTRYRLLDIIREFGAEQLAESGGAAALRARHIDHHLTRTEHFGAHVLDGDQVPRYRALRRSHADLRAALEYALEDTALANQAARLAGSLWGYWQISGALSEGRYWQDRVLSRFPSAGDERAWALIVRGYLLTLQGHPAEAVDDIREGIRLAEDSGARLMAGRGHLYLHLALSLTGRAEEAAAEGEAAERAMSQTRDHTGLCFLDAQIGYLHQLTGDFDACVARCEQGLARLGEDGGERWLRGYLHFVGGTALYARGSHTAATSEVRTALWMKHELGDTVGTAYCLELLGWLAAAADRYDRAAWLLGAADALWRKSGGRLSGTAVMEEFHERAEGAAREKLGTARFEDGYRAGVDHPLDDVVVLAVDDADRLARVPAQGGGNGAASAAAELTRREREVAGLLGAGLSNREIAERLVVSKRTVDSHMEHILAKLGVSSRTDIMALLRSGELDVAAPE